MQKTFNSKSLFHNFSLLLLVLIYALLIISIDSCTGDQPATPEENSSLPEENSSLSNSFYPLQVGNQWVYHKLEVGYDTVSVKGERIIDGKKYFEVFRSDSPIPPSLYREENGVIYDRYEGNDYIILDPSRPLGEKWQRPYNRSAYIDSHSDTVFSSIGPILNCIKVIIDGELDISEIVYAPGVGEVSSNLQFKEGVVIGGNIVLIYAIINGDTISFTY